jgi:glycosyltransferase involved in cell wall biosynthesis
MIFNVLMDLGKLKQPFSGLGQFSLNYGKFIKDKKVESLKWNFLVPKSKIGIYGENSNYESITLKRRYFPSICRKYHLWHALHQDSAYFPSNKDTPLILTIHDLNFLKEKNAFTAKRRLKQLQKKVDRATAITFVSNYTASVSKENLNLEGKDLLVIPNGVEIDTEKPAGIPSFLPDGKFLFTLGMVLKKKNFLVLIDFIRLLPEYNLIISGDKTNAYAKMIQERINKYNLQNRVCLPGIISEEDKIYLYRNCEAFLFPSKMEGFGLPVIEAMRFGKPVFISKHTSLPEIGGELAYYWQNFHPNNMVNLFNIKLKQFKEDEENRSQKIKEYSQQYNWETSIEKYLNLYVSVINKHYGDSLTELIEE